MGVVGRPRPQTRPGEGPQCHRCGHWYAGRKHLLKHVARIHQADLPVACPGCDRRFLDPRSCQTHVGARHPEIVRHRRNDPSVQREWNLRAKYGITLEQYDALLVAQGGTCAGCFSSEAAQRSHRLHVDHDHETGVVRGLLCGSCNQAIGRVHDSPERLRRLADYLERG